MRELIELSKKLLFEIDRIDMPQIKSNDVPTALEKLEKAGISVSHKRIECSVLKPTQENYNNEKVDNIKNSLEAVDEVDPIVCSNDNRIVDGHHRWVAVKEKFGENSKIPSYVIGVSIDKALGIYSALSKKQ